MQNPNEDTEWNDVLRAKGIIPQKEVEVTEDQIIEMLEDTVKQKTSGKQPEDMDSDELDELLDDEMDEAEVRVLERLKQQRMQEYKEAMAKARFGDVVPVSKPEFVDQVTNASKQCWVLVHLYQNQVQDSLLLSNYWTRLAKLYPSVKFCAIRADACIENYPDRNVPTILAYHNGELQKQIVTLFPVLQQLGVKQATFEDIERYFISIGALEMSLSRQRELEEAEKDTEEESSRNGKIRVGY